jgi:hypothetical protein
MQLITSCIRTQLHLHVSGVREERAVSSKLKARRSPRGPAHGSARRAHEPGAWSLNPRSTSLTSSLASRTGAYSPFHRYAAPPTPASCSYANADTHIHSCGSEEVHPERQSEHKQRTQVHTVRIRVQATNVCTVPHCVAMARTRGRHCHCHYHAHSHRGLEANCSDWRTIVLTCEPSL